MMKGKIALGVLLASLLVACKGQAKVYEPAPVMMLPSVTVITPIKKMATPTNFPSISTPVSTLTPSKLTKQEISNAIANADYDVLCGGPAEPTISLSPNSDWGAVFCFEFTKIFRLNGTQEWVISTNKLVLPNEFLRGDNLFVSDWSEDGQYVYIRLFACCVDGGPGGMALYDQALYQMNLITGDLSVLLPPIDAFYSFEISPNTQFVSYVKPNQLDKVFVRNLETNEDISLKLDKEYEKVGSFVWSSDSDSAYFAGQSKDWDKGLGGFSLFFLNVKKNSISILLDNDARLLIPTKWLEQDVLLLWSPKIVENNQYWAYNVKTKEIVPTQER